MPVAARKQDQAGDDNRCAAAADQNQRYLPLNRLRRMSFAGSSSASCVSNCNTGSARWVLSRCRCLSKLLAAGGPAVYSSIRFAISLCPQPQFGVLAQQGLQFFRFFRVDSPARDKTQ